MKHLRNLGGVVLVLALLLAYAPPGLAEPLVNNSISVTSTSQTITLAHAVGSIHIENLGTTNEMFVRVFTNTETSAAATTTTGFYIGSGKSLTLYFDPRWEPGSGYIALSLVCDTAETTTGRYVAK